MRQFDDSAVKGALSEIFKVRNLEIPAMPCVVVMCWPNAALRSRTCALLEAGASRHYLVDDDRQGIRGVHVHAIESRHFVVRYMNMYEVYILLTMHGIGDSPVASCRLKLKSLEMFGG